MRRDLDWVLTRVPLHHLAEHLLRAAGRLPVLRVRHVSGHGGLPDAHRCPVRLSSAVELWQNSEWDGVVLL